MTSKSVPWLLFHCPYYPWYIYVCVSVTCAFAQNKRSKDFPSVPSSSCILLLPSCLCGCHRDSFPHALRVYWPILIGVSVIFQPSTARFIPLYC
ncbi:hypothetical protein QR685DRAFT_81323 [Neurospora intermedia]|uniref:Uncharacterized protein n=1 Tax=Neurospora intermedia TaxID=5142 RepID=A0ABR3D4P9_NEUIN